MDVMIFPLASVGPIVTSLDIEAQGTIDLPVLSAIISSHNPADPTKVERLRASIVQIAQSTVGIRLQDLTAAQIKALMVCVLYKAGGFDPLTGTVPPMKMGGSTYYLLTH